MIKKNLSSRQSAGICICMFACLAYGFVGGWVIFHTASYTGLTRLSINMIGLALISIVKNALVWCNLSASDTRKRFYFGGALAWLFLFYLPLSDYLMMEWGWDRLLMDVIILICWMAWTFYIIHNDPDFNHGRRN